MIFTKKIDYDFWATLLKLFSSVKRVTVPSLILLSSQSRFHLIWAIIRPTIMIIITLHKGGLKPDSFHFFYNTPEAQSTVGYGDRVKRTTTTLHKINEYGPRDIDYYPIPMIFSPAWWRIYFSRAIISEIRSCKQMNKKHGRFLNFQNLIVAL